MGGQLLTGCTETKNPEQQTDDNKFITDAGMMFQEVSLFGQNPSVSVDMESLSVCFIV